MSLCWKKFFPRYKTMADTVIKGTVSDAVREHWVRIEHEYGAEVCEALRMLYEYYDGERIAEWIVSLYDGETGGFYYCASARDTDGYLPDLESTSQALSILAEIGAIPTEQVNEILTDSVREGLIGFALDRQSPQDGYFYHPQWPQGRENLNTDRYGRDQGNATSILRRVKCERDENGELISTPPRFCTVNGVKCARHRGTDACCTFAKNESAESIASVPRSDKHPDYTDRESFSAWLERYNASIHEDSGGAHNLAALYPEIKAHGYLDILLEHLDRKQAELFEEQIRLGETPGGIWQRRMDYRAVWGIFKYTYIFNAVDHPLNLKYVPYMVDSCINVINLPPLKNYAYNDLMNQWSAISAIIANVRRFHGDAEVEKIYARVRTGVAALVRNSLEKMLPFKMEDRAFCNKVSGVTTPIIYGVPIAVGDVAEGNVNSTHILLNMYFSICRAIGAPSIPLCDVSVGLRAARALEEKRQACIGRNA